MILEIATRCGFQMKFLYIILYMYVNEDETDNQLLKIMQHHLGRLVT